MTRILLSVLVLLLVAVWTAPAPAAPAREHAPAKRPAPLPRIPQLVRALPALTPTDVPSRGTAVAARSTFSPNDDGVNDLLHVSALGRPGRSLELRVWRRFKASSLVRTVGPVRIRRGGSARLAWDGRDSAGQPVADGSYVVRLCPGGGVGACFGPPRSDARDIVTHVRRLSAGIATAGSFAPGERIPLVIGSDTRRLCAAVLPDDAAATDAPPFGEGCAKPARLAPHVPAMLAPGMWRLRIRDNAGSVRMLPLVVRAPASLDAPAPGTVLVVAPYLTWRAYDYVDADRNGAVDSWYSSWRNNTVPLTGAYEGWPDGAEKDHRYARTFQRWFSGTPGRNAQFVTDVELARMSVASLRAYRAVLFFGHEEYYEPVLYDNLMAYLHSGGRIATLSANSFFRQVSVDPVTNKVTLLAHVARDAQRSDYAIVGVGFAACCFHVATHYQLTNAVQETPWLFAGTGLGPGDELAAEVGGEIDDVDAALTPAGTRVVAVSLASDIGTGYRAAMAWTPVPGGGEVFAAGNMALLSSLSSARLTPAERATVSRMLDNLWAHLASD